MSMPPFTDEWRMDWHLVAHVDQLPASGEIHVVVAGVRLRVSNGASGLTARADGRSYPLMVVDGEIFVLLSDEPD